MIPGTSVGWVLSPDTARAKAVATDRASTGR
jgi:hypothetical protein